MSLSVADTDVVEGRRRTALARIDRLWKAQQPAEALAEAEAALLALPADPAIALKRAAMLSRLDRMPEAMGALAALHGDHPGNVAVALALANARRDAGDQAGALALIETVLATEPHHPGALFAGIELLAKARRYGEALPLVVAALALRPGDRRLTLQRGYFLCKLSRAAEAVAILAPLHQAHPHDTGVALDFARARLAAGDVAGSVAVVASLQAAGPSHLGALSEIIDGLSKAKRQEQALACVDAALALLPEEPALLRRRGRLLRRLGKGAAAVAVLQALHHAQPDDVGLALDLALAHLAAGNPDGSVSAIASLGAAGPAHRAGLVDLVDGLWKASWQGQALACADAALALLPGERDLLLRRGRFLRRLGDAPAAVAVLLPLHHAHPGDAQVAMELALAQQAAGDHRAGVVLLDRHGRDVGVKQLAEFLLNLDRAQQDDESLRWLDRVGRHAATLDPAMLWALYLLADRHGLVAPCRRLMGALLDQASLPLPLARRILRHAQSAGDPHRAALAQRLRARLRDDEGALFTLEFDASEGGAEAALCARRRTTPRPPAEVDFLGGLLIQAGKRRLALRYLSRARRACPDDQALRHRHLTALAEAGQAEAARAEVARLLSAAEPVSPDGRLTAITTLFELGDAEEAMRLIDASEDVRSRPGLDFLRVRLLIRLGRLAEAAAVLQDRARRGSGKGAAQPGPSLIEIDLANRAAPAGGEAEPALLDGQVVGSSLRAIEPYITRRSQDGVAAQSGPGRIPRVIVQYRDGDPRANLLPLMQSWRVPGFEYRLFDRAAAQGFVTDRLGGEWASAMRLAQHPAAEKDFFLLCFLMVEGGIYADCGDRLDGRLDDLVAQAAGLLVLSEPPGTIAGNVILAAPRHPVVGHAAFTARQALLRRDGDSIWGTTGPGLLTRVVAMACEEAAALDVEPGFTIWPRYLAAHWVQFGVQPPGKAPGAPRPMTGLADVVGGHPAEVPSSN